MALAGFGTLAPSVARGNGRKGKPSGKKKGNMKCREPVSWEEKLKGKLEYDSSDQNMGNDGECITIGKVIMKDLRNLTVTESKIDILCIHCGKKCSCHWVVWKVENNFNEH